MSRVKQVVLIMGPSCAGKTVLESALAAHDGFNRIVSYTTREQRPGERDGVNYDFVSESFAAGIARDNDCVESAEVLGHTYGVTRQRFNQALNTGVPVVVADPAGCKTYRAYARQNGIVPLQVFVTGPTSLLIARWLDRYEAEGPERWDSVRDKYARRIASTVMEETEWSRGRPIDLTFYGLGETMSVDFAVTQIVDLVSRRNRETA